MIDNDVKIHESYNIDLSELIQKICKPDQRPTPSKIIEMPFLQGIPQSCKPIKEYEENYIEKKFLGKGAFGTAWKIKHIRNRKKYVAKKGNKEAKGVVELSLIEMNLLRKLDHRNIVKIYDCFLDFETKSEPILILELCRHGDLSHLIRKK